MIIAYEIIKNEYVKINACFDYQRVVKLPDEINGLMVEELAPYAFSDKEIEIKNCMLWRSDELAVEDDVLPPRICGNKLEEIVIPKSVKKIGRYAFYGCEELKALTMHSTTIDLGNGIFMGCNRLNNLNIIVDESVRSSLHELLLMFCHSLKLHYYVTDPLSGKNELKYLLVFPPYYENNDENTPARITFRDLHGSGLYYRNSFANTAFKIDKYDSLFAHAVANEEESISMELALARILFPAGLKENDKEKYMTFICEHISSLSFSLHEFLNSSICSLNDIRNLLMEDYFNKEMLSVVIEKSAEIKAQDLLSLCMDIKKARFLDKSENVRKRRFEL
ncbi:MAG: leucine-rich repeat protein [Eubacteriales bacterium]|nr:leucine-rich repeat protein [Eubacteriales bacterium]